MQKISQLKIEKLVFKGYGLGFDHHTPVFVSNTVPGDVVEVTLDYRKGDCLFASISEIVSPSPERIAAGCEVFGTCGGCDWLTLTYQDQLKYKQIITDEIFHKISVEKVLPICGCAFPDFYRNKGFFPVSQQNGIPIVGMYAKKTHDVIPHEHCLLHPEMFDRIIEVFRQYLMASRLPVYDEKTGHGNIRHLGIRYSATSGELLIVLVTKSRKLPFSHQLVRVLQENFPNLTGVVQNINPHSTNVILGEEDKIIFGRDHIFTELAGKRFKLNYKSFFQINEQTAKNLIEFIRTEVSGNILDAYCGVGSIGIALADQAEKVIGIENNPAAVNDATRNAEINLLSNCHFICDDVEQKLPEICQKEQINTIIFDPPRKGLAASIITKLPPQITKIIYISCDPKTQARDVEKLISSGFVAGSRRAFDMFPHTYHIENVVILERK